jgi:hypothetical protein
MTQPYEEADQVEPQAGSADEPAPRRPVEPPPVYRKPTLRRYDQIEQVRPYGPSERRAG